MSKLYSLNSVFPLVNSLYGVDADENDFEDMALNAWGLIGNKHTRLYKYSGTPIDGVLELPCNAEYVESVTIPILDAQITSPDKNTWNMHDNVYIENYVENRRHISDPLYLPGKFIKYREGNGTIYVDKDYPVVNVLYHGILCDNEDGLPLINEKEQRAIACYVAYLTLFKDAIKRRSNDALTLAKQIEAEWLRRCNNARTPEYLSQNDVDKILDAKTRWDRKFYGKSFKPTI